MNHMGTNCAARGDEPTDIYYQTQFLSALWSIFSVFQLIVCSYTVLINCIQELKRL